jgi:hypothetical protein
VIVPAGALWMTVVLGVDPSTGTARFDDIHINLLDPVPPGQSMLIKSNLI